jgi:hypothetical protein
VVINLSFAMLSSHLRAMPVDQPAAADSALQVQPAHAAQPQPETLTPYMQGDTNLQLQAAGF